MAKVHERVARKDYPDDEIKAGDKYFTWSLRSSHFGKGTVYRSKTYPTPRQLTRNEFMLALYDIDDSLASVEGDTAEDIDGSRTAVCDQIRDLAQEQQDKLDNMPEGLQQGDTGQLLQERIDNLESWASDIESVELPDEDEFKEEDDPKEAFEDAIESAIEEIRGIGFPG